MTKEEVVQRTQLNSTDELTSGGGGCDGNGDAVGRGGSGGGDRGDAAADGQGGYAAGGYWR